MEKNFNKTDISKLNMNTISAFNNDWALVTAGNSDSYNTMTVSWGGLGFLWNRPVATIYIRPQRHTFKFIEENGYFTVSFFDESYKDALRFCGKYSGKDYDKAKECNLSPTTFDDSVSFKEAKLVLVCKKLYFSDFDKNNFCVDGIDSANYPNNDYHRMYIGEIVTAYQK